MNTTLTSGKMAEWCGGRWAPRPPSGPCGICHDTRNIKSGDVYVALKGDRYDGHDFVQEAFEKGAAGAVVSERWKKAHDTSGWGRNGMPLLPVSDTGTALLEMGRGYLAELELQVVGITGSTGKTTTKELAADMIGTGYAVGRTRGNWNNRIGVPLSILSLPPSTEVGVFEIGMNHPGELRELAELISPDVGLITTIAPVHVENFSSLEAIAHEKAELIRALEPEGTAIMTEPSYSFDAVRAATGCNLVTVGIEEGNGYRCVAVDRQRWIARILELQSGEEAEIEAPIPGEHNLLNVMLAVAAARRFNIGWADIRKAVKAYRPPPMRWERRDIGSRVIINDAYNANPLSMRASIDTFLGRSGEEKWLILGGMAELGQASDAEHVRLGEYIGLRQWQGAILVGELAERMAEGVRMTRGATRSLFLAESTEQAAEIAATAAGHHAEIFLKGSRFMQMERIVDKLEDSWKEQRGEDERRSSSTGRKETKP